MTTAHNEHTGASLTTAGKGSLEKYAQGWDAIFKPKEKIIEEHTWTLANGSTITFKGDPNGYAEFTSFSKPMESGHFMVDDSHVIPMMVEPTFIEDSFPKSYDSFAQPFNSFTMPHAGAEHSVDIFKGIAESDAFTAEAAHKAFAGLKRGSKTDAA